jgi:flagellar basal-body rod protein FlgB
VEPETLRLYDEVYRLDGNNVDPEREEALMAQTRMTYRAMNSLLAKKAGIYKNVIGGR